MNIFMLLFIFLIGICAVFGVIYVGSQSQTAPIVDTYGSTTNASTNATHAAMGNLTATGTQVGGGIVLLIAGVIAFVVVIALAYVGTRKRGSSFGRGS